MSHIRDAPWLGLVTFLQKSHCLLLGCRIHKGLSLHFTSHCSVTSTSRSGWKWRCSGWDQVNIDQAQWKKTQKWRDILPAIRRYSELRLRAELLEDDFTATGQNLKVTPQPGTQWYQNGAVLGLTSKYKELMLKWPSAAELSTSWGGGISSCVFHSRLWYFT